VRGALTYHSPRSAHPSSVHHENSVEVIDGGLVAALSEQDQKAYYPTLVTICRFIQRGGWKSLRVTAEKAAPARRVYLIGGVALRPFSHAVPQCHLHKYVVYE
jgi:hypothetical protein